MLKGHTKIELTDVNTGEVKVVEDDNIVTNAMAKMLEFNPYIPFNSGAPDPFNTNSPFIDRFCGGILLFRDAIEENPENCLIPNGNKMIGNARINYASPNDVPEFGAFNGEESYWNEETGERKYVYDFATSKANGTISCVALTNFLSGYWGVGNSSGKRESATVENVQYGTRFDWTTNFFWNTAYNLPNSVSCPSGMTVPTGGKILFADYDENCVYVFNHYALTYDSSQDTQHIKHGTLKVSKVEFPFQSLNPMCQFGKNRKSRIVKQIDIPVPSEIASINQKYTKCYDICRTDDAIYILFVNNNNGSAEVDANIYVWKIGYDLETSEVFTVKNTTGVKIVLCSNPERTASHIEDGYLICSAVDGCRMFKINLSDPTDVTELENLTTYTNKLDLFAKLGNILIARSSGYSLRAVVNLTENTVCPINGEFDFTSSGYYYNHSIIPIRGTDNFFIKAYENNFFSDSTYLMYTPFFMSTINNLPEPVVKTSDLTMKITYTLTLIGDEEEGDS